ncbi:MAG: mCpol domain-containing protein [Pseudomonadota bacterium]|nr:mCpol domain-containing protein [Pseudomonadota bacterium]
MKYITVDGDDVGSKIASCYMINDEEKLENVSRLIKNASDIISKRLEEFGFRIVFSAADGVAAFAEDGFIPSEIFAQIKNAAGSEIQYSAGAGTTLRHAYFSLIMAKSIGKNQICSMEEDIDR